jgi:hypothetical protein
MAEKPLGPRLRGDDGWGALLWAVPRAACALEAKRAYSTATGAVQIGTAAPHAPRPWPTQQRAVGHPFRLHPAAPVKSN